MEKSLSEIKDAIVKLNEADLRKILIKIFEEKGFLEVIENHGSQEFGKDICFYELSKFNEKTWYSCVVKVKDVNQSQFAEIKRQVRECFENRYRSHKHGYTYIDKVIVITNGVYKENAKTIISEDFSANNRNISYWALGDVAEELFCKPKIQDLLFAASIDINQSIINLKTQDILLKDSSLKVIYNELNFSDENSDRLDLHVNVKAKLKELQDETFEYLKSTEPDSVITKVPAKYIPEKIEDLLKIEKPILIHGIETSGKTTYIKRIGIDFIKKGINGCVLFFELIKVKDKITKESIEKLISDTAREYITQEYEISADKTYLILLDGLDEIASESERDIVLDKVIQLCESSKEII